MVQQVNLSNASSGTWIAVFQDHQDLIYKCMGVPIPSVSCGSTSLEGPDVYNLYETGDKLDYDPLDLEFLIDSNWANYKAVYQWLISNANSGQADTKDLTLILLDPNGQPQGVSIVFTDCFPTDLSKVTLSTTGEQTDLSCAVTLRYTSYDFN